MRIFLLGNGPSLAITPLDDLLGEDTFAMNRIHLIYDKVKWRPTYFQYVDYTPLNKGWRDPIEANAGVAKHQYLLEDFHYGLPVGHPNHDSFPPSMAVGDLPNTTWIPRCEKHRMYSPGHPDGMKEWHFPEVCTAYNGMSTMIQLSVQMGYDEIYLLGCDLGYQFDWRKNHFDPMYNEKYQPKYDYEIAYWIQTDEFNANHVHKIAKDECAKRGVKIFNATLGGNLEVYPRVDLRKVLDG